MPDAYANPDRECDMVMKGGITSGVIYPKAICELAKRYHFRSIGGASAGAIAAGAAAAAEFGRASGGFDRLYALPKNAAEVLPTLFQPSKKTRPPMKALLTFLKPRSAPMSGLRKMMAIVGTLIRWRFSWFLGTFILIGAIISLGAIGMVGLPVADTDWSQIGGALMFPLALVAFPLAIVGAAIGMIKVVFDETPDNYMGLTTGMPGVFKGPALTPWLHETLQNLAGRSAILTLGDLWGAHGDDDADSSETPEERGKRRHIDLALVTSNLTQGMPYRLPLATKQWAYCQLCFQDLFPQDITTHLKANSEKPPLGDDGKAECPRHDKPEELRLLPEPGDMPVLVLVRMSLSFPVLISAIPLFFFGYVRHPHDKDQDGMYWKLNWFSDGGIGSNFPIHFFDSLWPSRPTFGIDLQPSDEGREAYRKQVGLDPEPMYYLRRPKASASPRYRPADSLGGFLGGVADTMQNWRDTSTAMSTGFADRVLTIYHRSSEGGMNLRMDPSVVTELADRGEVGAGEYQKKFRFGHHRWVRYRVAMTELAALLRGLDKRYDAQLSAPDWPAWVELIDDPDPHMGLDSKGELFSVPNTPSASTWRSRDEQRTEALIDVAKVWGADSEPVTKEEPSPRIRPVLRLESRQLDSGG